MRHAHPFAASLVALQRAFGQKTNAFAAIPPPNKTSDSIPRQGRVGSVAKRCNEKKEWICRADSTVAIRAKIPTNQGPNPPISATDPRTEDRPGMAKIGGDRVRDGLPNGIERSRFGRELP